MWKWIAIICAIITYTQCVKFGDDNSYTCHCIKDEQCNKDTGLCTGDCATGWSGASCQRQNVALGKTSNQVDTKGDRNSSLAVDGNRTTNIPNKCSDTGIDDSIRWWRVDLEEEYPIKYITIHYRSEPSWALASLNGFSLHVNKENEEQQLCYKDKNIFGAPPPAVNNIECDQVITGRYVNISNFHPDRNSRFLYLCEVEIYECSVGTFGSNCTNFCHCLNNERCSVTGECPGRCADGWTGTTCSQDQNRPVTVCTEGFYGDGCQKKCSNRKCLKDSSCDNVRGECIGGCSDGYILTDCSKACDIGMYGAGCLKLCSDRKCKDSNLQCDSKTGECIDGCQSGYQSIDCTQDCDYGTYGQDCQFNCSARFCKTDKECSNTDGACYCLEGYQGTDCTVEKATVRSGGANTGFTDQIWIAILTLIIGFLAGVLVALFIMKRRLRSKANKSHRVTSNQSSNNVTQQETTIDQPVTQPSVTQPSSTTNNNQDNPYDQLTTIYQNEHAYEHLEIV